MEWERSKERMIQIDTKRKKWILRMIAIVICFLAVIFLSISGLLAKYVSSEEGGGSARIASFFIDADFSDFEQSIPLEIKPEGSEEIIFTVSNDSEVDVHFSASMEFCGNLPLDMMVTDVTDSGTETTILTGTSMEASKMKWEDELKAREGNSGQSQSKRYKITVSWMRDATGYQYADGVGMLDLSVCAQQKE